MTVGGTTSGTIQLGKDHGFVSIDIKLLKKNNTMASRHSSKKRRKQSKKFSTEKGCGNA